MRTFQLDVTIPAGSSYSTPVPLVNQQPVLLMLPASWTGASVTFQVSSDAATWLDLFGDDGTELAACVGPGRSVVLDWPVLAASCLRLRSGTAAAPVAQQTDAVVTLATVDYRVPAWSLPIDETLESHEGEFF